MSRKWLYKSGFILVIVGAIVLSVYIAYLSYKNQGVSVWLVIAQALAYLLSIGLTIVGLLRKQTGKVDDRPEFHEHAAKIYEKAEESDSIFAVTTTWDMPREYVDAYRNCDANEILFCGPVSMENPHILGVLARIGLMCDKKGSFVMKHIPRAKEPSFLPKMAASTKEVLFGSEIHSGPSTKGTYVINKQLGRFLWGVLKGIVHKFQDIEELIANYLDKSCYDNDPDNCDVVFNSMDEVLHVFVNEEQIRRWWGERNTDIKSLAIEGIKHVINNHCKVILVKGGKVVKKDHKQVREPE